MFPIWRTIQQILTKMHSIKNAVCVHQQKLLTSIKVVCFSFTVKVKSHISSSKLEKNRSWYVLTFITFYFEFVLMKFSVHTRKFDFFMGLLNKKNNIISALANGYKIFFSRPDISLMELKHIGHKVKP